MFARKTTVVAGRLSLKSHTPFKIAGIAGAEADRIITSTGQRVLVHLIIR